jgi:hypothetical protein
MISDVFSQIKKLSPSGNPVLDENGKKINLQAKLN